MILSHISGLLGSTDEHASSCSAIPVSQHCRIRVKWGWRGHTAGSPRLESIVAVKCYTSWKRHFLASHIVFAYLARFTAKNIFLISKLSLLFEVFHHCIMSHMEWTWRTDYFCSNLFYIDPCCLTPVSLPQIEQPQSCPPSSACLQHSVSNWQIALPWAFPSQPKFCFHVVSTKLRAEVLLMMKCLEWLLSSCVCPCCRSMSLVT